jgi:hypothetical protein
LLLRALSDPEKAVRIAFLLRLRKMSWRSRTQPFLSSSRRCCAEMKMQSARPYKDKSAIAE